MEENGLLICPYNNCKRIPEISYSFDPFNPIIIYKCRYHSKGKSEEEMELEKFFGLNYLNIKCSR